MTTEESKKLNSDTIKNLKSSNSELINETLDQLSESGNSAYIPFLVELLQATSIPETKKRVTQLLAELKHSDAIPLIIEAIKNKKYNNELQYLVSACWENGMDYTEHLPLFVDLMIEHEFIVAFEAYTVINNMTGKISSEICHQESLKVENALQKVNDEKRHLLSEVLEFLPVLEAGIEPLSF